MRSDRPQLTLCSIDLERHADICVRFCEDAIQGSFGSTDSFHGADGQGATRYLARLRQRQESLPGSAMHAWLDGRIVGQIQMSILSQHPPALGYVSLFYLLPQWRGNRLGDELQAYAMQFFAGLGCSAVRLSAHPTNRPEWRFYQRHGWQDLGPREDEPSVHLLHKDLSGTALT
ncbi:GNAT family N-acetyltransferase [Pseudomonas sp. MM211]|uniref:GNAT family N-acetyltransferase n=1 Tax=Pseudomonas sp. MM211 TaxID=2866808 RepID=UPI001CED5BD9|nr:GNAT family N-acetyltransferase [Pseudomonas sp. MM211]UCJ15572.1 GNAT family N-acetyltransferase [Pseudomonas sp. MM211]